MLCESNNIIFLILVVVIEISIVFLDKLLIDELIINSKRLINHIR
jgi:hypothetical protein